MWKQDSSNSTMAHWFNGDLALCGAKAVGPLLENDNNFTGFCGHCSQKAEGQPVPGWALKYGAPFPRSRS